MAYRTVVMYMEIGCFVICVAGWILVCSTMPTEIWTWSEVDSIVLTTSNYFSNLWKDCISDSTGVSDCKGIPSMLALNWDIHMCRALIIISIILAFFGSILVLVGMKCTKIGGTEIANARVTFAGGMNYLVSGMCSMVAFSYYGNKIRAEFQDPTFRAQRFEIGVGVFIGWAGSTLLVVGGLIYSIFAGREGCQSTYTQNHTLLSGSQMSTQPSQQIKVLHLQLEQKGVKAESRRRQLTEEPAVFLF
ncbi:claudin-10-like isoform X2 [Sphaeramia orbicularis]|uniref:claudin-10-like isoform X2 n=1 Tax=Sphaeramia orbicularis TaxID=375764 RepID=UPI00117EF6C3|nr:claudin-10-like isoform X2 [Sphaeramia orbicularis]